MKRPKTELIAEIEEMAYEHFDDRQFFFCVYGSHATGESSDASDLDLFFATPTVTPRDADVLAEWMTHFHRAHNLALDEEVPFDNKLVASYGDLQNAVQLKGLNEVDGRIFIPPIVKDPIFLASAEVRYRLLFNALTTPHIMRGSDVDSYNAYKEIAELSLYRLLLDIALERDRVNAEVELLLRGPNGEEGEMFLGYKRNRATLTYLERIINQRTDHEGPSLQPELSGAT